MKKSKKWKKLEAKLSSEKTENSRFVVVGMTDLSGFDAIANGTEENVPLMTKSVVFRVA